MADPKELDRNTLAAAIGRYLPLVMRDRKNMPLLEQAVDTYIKDSYTSSPEAKKSLTDQLLNAKLALESLYNRIVQQL